MTRKLMASFPRPRPPTNQELILRRRPPSKGKVLSFPSFREEDDDERHLFGSAAGECVRVVRARRDKSPTWTTYGKVPPLGSLPAVPFEGDVMGRA